MVYSGTEGHVLIPKGTENSSEEHTTSPTHSGFNLLDNGNFPLKSKGFILYFGYKSEQSLNDMDEGKITCFAIPEFNHPQIQFTSDYTLQYLFFHDTNYIVFVDYTPVLRFRVFHQNGRLIDSIEVDTGGCVSEIILSPSGRYIYFHVWDMVKTENGKEKQLNAIIAELIKTEKSFEFRELREIRKINEEMKFKEFHIPEEGINAEYNSNFRFKGLFVSDTGKIYYTEKGKVIYEGKD